MASAQWAGTTSLDGRFVRVQSAAAGAPALVVFPWAGAGALRFRSWPAMASASLEVCRLPGREDRSQESPPPSWGAMIEDLLASLPPPPFVFYGHCMGAVIAFDLTRRLRSLGRRLPERLIVTGDSPAQVHAAPPIADVRAELLRSGMAGTELMDDDVFPLFSGLFELDFRLLAGYRYSVEPPLPTPLTYLRSGPNDDDALKGWQSEVQYAVDIRRMSADALRDDGAWQNLARTVMAEVIPVPPTHTDGGWQ